MSWAVPTVKTTLSAACAGLVAARPATHRAAAAMARPAQPLFRCCMDLPLVRNESPASWHIRSIGLTRGSRWLHAVHAPADGGERRRAARWSWAMAPTTLRAGMPVTPPPPWVAEPAM